MVRRARQALVAHGNRRVQAQAPLRARGRSAVRRCRARDVAGRAVFRPLISLGHLRHHVRRGVLRNRLPGAALGAAAELFAPRHPDRGGFGGQRRNPGDGPSRRRAVRVGGGVRRLRVRLAGADCGASDVDRPVPVRTPPLRPGCAFEHDPSRAPGVPNHRAGAGLVAYLHERAEAQEETLRRFRARRSTSPREWPAIPKLPKAAHAPSGATPLLLLVPPEPTLTRRPRRATEGEPCGERRVSVDARGSLRAFAGARYCAGDVAGEAEDCASGTVLV